MFPSPLCFLRGGEIIYRDRDTVSSPAWGHKGTQECARRGFFLHHLHSPEERRWPPAHYQPQVPEQVCSPPPLQNGGATNWQGRNHSGGLHVQAGPKGRLPYGPSNRATSQISVIPMGAEMLPLYLPIFRPLVSPLDFHQSHSPSCPIPPDPRHKNDSLPGRHALPPSAGGEAAGGQGVSSRPAGKSGLSGELQEVGTIPNAEDQLPRIHDRLGRYEGQSPTGEDRVYSEGSQDVPQHTPDISSSAGPHGGRILSHNSSSTPSSLHYREL